MVERTSPSQPAKPLDSVRQDIHTLDSKISLIAQKLRTIEQNEEIIGRTIVAHNEKIKEIEERGENSPAPVASSSFPSGDYSDLKKQIDDLRKELSEMRYVLNSINPLEFATLDQVRELLKDKKA